VTGKSFDLPDESLLGLAEFRSLEASRIFTTPLK
jgi:hypothetical protein